MRETISDASGFVVAISIFVLLISIVWLIIRFIRKKSVKPGIIVVVTCIASIIIFTVIGMAAWSGTEDYQIAMAEKEQEELERKAQEESQRRSEEQIEAQTETETESANTEMEEETEETNAKQTTERSIDSEQEYKDKCAELYYDDVFFGDDDLEGKYIKMHLFFSEKYFFTNDDLMYNNAAKELYNKNNLYRDFYKCCVLREGTNSYVGQQIDVFFTQDYELNPSNYKTGQKVIMYGKVIYCATNTWKGYNQVYFIPKYIEVE